MTETAETAEYVDEGYNGSYHASFFFAKHLIANCPTFREVIIGVQSAAEAMEKIYYQETLAEAHPDLVSEYEGDAPPETQPRPYCVLMPQSRSRRKIAHKVFSGEGSILAVFEVLIPDELKIDYEQDGPDVIAQKFERRKLWRMGLAKIEDEITDLAGGHDENGNPFLNVTDPEWVIDPADAADSQAEDHVGFAIALGWK